MRRLALLPVAALLLVSCASPADPAGSQAPAVLAAEDVFETEPVVVPDISGTIATVRVTTTVEMACAVVFGTDETLGDGIATDDDMAGGAHTEHEAVMTGLEPDTEYHYRVQGSGADGNLYRSELRTFRTPPADATATPGENVAPAGEVVDASSQFSEAFAPEAAIDGDLGTEWSSDGDGDAAWIVVDLGRPVEVAGVSLRSRSMTDGSSVIETFTVTVDDGEVLGPYQAGSTFTVHEEQFTGQVLRFDADGTTGGNTGAAEIEVYEAP